MVIQLRLFGGVTLDLDLAVCLDLGESKFHETTKHTFDSTSIPVNIYRRLISNIYVETHLLKVNQLIDRLEKLCDH